MIESYDPVWLADAALYWNGAADHLHDAFGQVHADAQRLGWQGASGDALSAHTLSMHTDAIGVVNQMRGAATIAREGASNLTALASKARYAIEDAQTDGFTVGEDLSVTDARASRDPVEQAARQAQAQTHAGNIVRSATALWTHDTAVGEDMTGATAGIQAAGHGFKQDGPPPPPAQPHTGDPIKLPPRTTPPPPTIITAAPPDVANTPDHAGVGFPNCKPEDVLGDGLEIVAGGLLTAASVPVEGATLGLGGLAGLVGGGGLVYDGVKGLEECK
jgi:hypothetical protein